MGLWTLDKTLGYIGNIHDKYKGETEISLSLQKRSKHVQYLALYALTAGVNMVL